MTSYANEALFILDPADQSAFDIFPIAANHHDIIATKDIELIRIDDGTLPIPLYCTPQIAEDSLSSSNLNLSDEYKQLITNRLNTPITTSIGDNSDNRVDLSIAISNYIKENIYDVNSGEYKKEFSKFNSLNFIPDIKIKSTSITIEFKYRIDITKYANLYNSSTESEPTKQYSKFWHTLNIAEHCAPQHCAVFTRHVTGESDDPQSFSMIYNPAVTYNSSPIHANSWHNLKDKLYIEPTFGYVTAPPLQATSKKFSISKTSSFEKVIQRLLRYVQDFFISSQLLSATDFDNALTDLDAWIATFEDLYSRFFITRPLTTADLEA